MNKISKKSYLITLILLVFIFSSLASLLQPIAVSAADDSKYGKANFEDRVKSKIYYLALAHCVEKNYGTETGDTSDVSVWRFFTRSKGNTVLPAGDLTSTIGYLASKGQSLDCNVEGEWVKSAYNFFGWTDPYEAVCGSGFSRTNGSACLPKNGGSGNYDMPKVNEDFLPAFKAYYFGSNDPTAFSDGEKYFAYYKSLTSAVDVGCGATRLGTYDSKNITNEQAAIISDPNKGGLIWEKGAGNTRVEAIYKYSGSFDGRANVDTWEGSNPKCSDVMNFLHQDAGINDYLNYLKIHPNDPLAEPATTPGTPESNPDGTTAGTTTCSIPAVGWIICPVVTFMSTVADKSYDFIKDNFLSTNVSMFANTGSTPSPLNSAWSAVRNTTNAGLVIIFLIIIFSQLTGLGISNYGIKKMLPRLIIAAILANLSFFICQIAVELSNIIGYQLTDFLTKTIPAATGACQDFLSTGGSSETWKNIGGAVILGAGGAAVLYGAFGLLAPVLLAVVLAVVMTLFILVARQVIIILLVIVAPAAFLLMILPNTEKLFKRWRQMFIALLIVYPTVALLFAASKVASQVISAAYGQCSVVANELTSLEKITGAIIAAGISVLPLFALPWVIRTSLNAVPIAGNLASRWQQRANRAVGSRARTAAQSGDIARARGVRRDELANRRNTRYAGRVTGGGIRAIPARIAAGRAGGQALGRTAQAAADAADETAVKNADAMLDHAGDNGAALTKDQITELALTGSVAGLRRNFNEYDQRAAMQRHIASAGVNDSVDKNGNIIQGSGLHNLVAGVQTGNYSDNMRRTMGKAIASRKDDVPYMNAGLADAVTRGTANASTLAAEQTATAAKVRPSELATARPEAIAAMQQAAYVEAQNGNDDALTKLQASANYLLTHDDARELRQNIAPNSDLYNSLIDAASVPIP